MSNSVLEALYGTDDIEKIYSAKSSEKQEKVLTPNSGKSTKRVKLTVEKCKTLCEAAGLDYLEGYEGRVVEHVITNETVDRYGDIVKASGVDFKTNYLNNPTIQYSHDYKIPPIGKTIKIWHDKASGCIKAWGLYYDSRIDDSGFSESIFKFIVSNAMPACSIGFVPKKARRPKNEDERKQLGLGEYGVLFEEVDLLEYSPCSIGANPDALKNSIKSGEISKKDCEIAIEKKLFDDSIFTDILKGIKEVEVPEVVKTSTEDPNQDLIDEINSLKESNENVIKSNLEVIENINNASKTIQELSGLFSSSSKAIPLDVSSELEEEKNVEKVLSILDQEIKLTD